MSSILYEGSLFGRISLRVLLHVEPPLVRLEVEGERETRLYEWGSLIARNNNKDLEKTLLDISTRACASEAEMTGKPLADIQEDAQYVRLKVFMQSLAVD